MPSLSTSLSFVSLLALFLLFSLTTNAQSIVLYADSQCDEVLFKGNAGQCYNQSSLYVQPIPDGPTKGNCWGSYLGSTDAINLYTTPPGHACCEYYGYAGSIFGIEYGRCFQLAPSNWTVQTSTGVLNVKSIKIGGSKK